MKNLFAFLAFVAACVFFACSVFGVALGGVPLVSAGLLCVAIGFALEAAPAAPTSG